MAIKSAPYYWVECDDCGRREDEEFSAWSDVRSAIDVVESWDYGWLITDDGHWCPDCRGKHEEEDE